MARPKNTDPEPIATCFAVLPAKGGGWILRTYLVPADSTPHEDAPVDTFAATMGKARRELAGVGK
jgi:hypothetical protein